MIHMSGTARTVYRYGMVVGIVDYCGLSCIWSVTWACVRIKMVFAISPKSEDGNRWGSWREFHRILRSGFGFDLDGGGEGICAVHSSTVTRGPQSGLRVCA